MSKSIEVDTKTFVRFWLVMAALGLIVLFIGQAATGLLIVGAALFFALAIWPLVKKVNKLIGKKKSRPGLSAGIVVGGVVAVILAALMLIGPVVVSETSKFLSTAPEQFQSTLSNWNGIDAIGNTFGISNARTQIINWFKQLSGNFLSSIPQTVFTSISTISGIFTGLILVIVLTVLFLTQGPDIMHKFWQKMGARHSKAAAEAERITGRLGGVISRYFTGQVLVAVLDGIVTAVAVFILSLFFSFSPGLALPMGLVALIFYLIPMFGPIITAALVTVILFFSSPFSALIFLVFYIIYEQIENNVISPRIQGNSMSLPPLIILIAVVIGMYMFGLIGAIISIPIAGCIKVLVDEYPNIKALKE